MFVTINLTSKIRLIAYLQNSKGQLRIENSKETHDETSYALHGLAGICKPIQSNFW